MLNKEKIAYELAMIFAKEKFRNYLKNQKEDVLPFEGLDTLSSYFVTAYSNYLVNSPVDDPKLDKL